MQIVQLTTFVRKDEVKGSDVLSALIAKNSNASRKSHTMGKPVPRIIHNAGNVTQGKYNNLIKITTFRNRIPDFIKKIQYTLTF